LSLSSVDLVDAKKIKEKQEILKKEIGPEFGNNIYKNLLY